MPLEPHVLSAQRITANQCHYLELQYPMLKDMGLEVRLDNANVVFQVYVELVKQLDPVAGQLARMEICRRLIELPSESGLREGPAQLLARDYIERGLSVYAARVLDPADKLQAEITKRLDEHYKLYGVDTRTLDSTGHTRGFSLLHYFSAHSDLLRKRDVAHIAPEQEFRGWIADMADTLACRYTTIDGFMPGMDRYEDLCSMTTDNDSFDTIICHRVLEHVFDGQSAYKELYRILRPGGVLNVSVPEAFDLKTTSEWVVPDPLISHHVRMYGRDFADQLRAAGFRVERADWLLERPFEELRAVKALPMLLYNAYKD